MRMQLAHVPHPFFLFFEFFGRGRGDDEEEGEVLQNSFEMSTTVLVGLDRICHGGGPPRSPRAPPESTSSLR